MKEETRFIVHSNSRCEDEQDCFDAYVAVGFTEEQALALMINDNIQLMKSIKQLSTSGGKASSKVNM